MNVHEIPRRFIFNGAVHSDGVDINIIRRYLTRYAFRCNRYSLGRENSTQELQQRMYRLSTNQAFHVVDRYEEHSTSDGGGKLRRQVQAQEKNVVLAVASRLAYTSIT